MNELVPMHEVMVVLQKLMMFARSCFHVLLEWMRDIWGGLKFFIFEETEAFVFVLAFIGVACIMWRVLTK